MDEIVGTDASNVISAFSEYHVGRLTGLSTTQLRYWDKTGFFSPRYGYEDRRSPYSRVYSFRDVVGLRTLAILRKEHRVSLQHLRQVADRLSHLRDDLWAETTLYVHDRKVYFHEAETDAVRGVVDGQFALLPLKRVMSSVANEANVLKVRPKEQVGKIERHRHVARNSWVVAGTRIPTGAIRRFHEAGYSIDQILREYPSLMRSDVQAALAHEKRLAQSA